MGSQTPRFKVPYVYAEDPITGYPAVGRALAERVDALNVSAGNAIANPFSAMSGWAITSQGLRYMGSLVLFTVGIKRTGGTITVSATGDVGNAGVVTLDVTKIGNGATAIAIAGPLGSGAAGRMAAFTISGNGAISLVATTPGGDITVNSELSFNGCAFTN